MSLVNCQCDVEVISPTLFVVKNFFTDQGLGWLLQHFQPGHNWQFQPHPSRLVHELPVIETGSELMTQVGQIVQQHCDKPLKNLGHKLFYDTRGYRTGFHYDSPDIAVMLQIYLASDYLGTPGTIFHIEKTYQTGFIPNSGYININQDLKLHESSMVISGCRKSFVSSFAVKD